MANNAVSAKEFWIGIAATIFVSVLAAAGSYVGTKAQINAQRVENQRAQDSQWLREIGVAVNGVRQQLLSHAGALMELENCMSQRKATMPRCRRVLDGFDAGKLLEAWSTFDATIRAATPFLTSSKEGPLLDKLKGIKKMHTSSIDPLLPANSAKSAQAILNRTQATMGALKELEEALLMAVTERARQQ